MIAGLPADLQPLAKVAEQQADAINISQPGAGICFVNDAFVRMFGYSRQEALGKTSKALLRSERHESSFFEDMEAKLMRGEAISCLLVSRRKDDSLIWQSATATPLLSAEGEIRFIVAVRRDLSQSLQIKRRLALSERLSAVGTLAAGVAHEINNPLTWMLAHAASLSAEHPGDDRISELLDGLQSIRATVAELLEMSDERGETQRPMALSVVLRRAVSAEAEALRHVRVRIDPSVSRLQVVGSPRLVEALAHLLRNAGQATPLDRSGAEVRISARAGGGRIRIWIMDRGVGVPPENAARIFDPFFTTRPLGEGLGLGLPTARAIIAGLGGTLAVQSRSRQGGVLVTVQLQDAAPVMEPTPLRLMLIDDDVRLSRALGRMLSMHSVEVINSGAEAVARLTADGRFDVVICDLMMPGMGGMEVYERVCRARPGLAERFLFTTGGAWSDEAQRFVRQHTSRVLEKPFSQSTIAAAIQRIVDAAPRRGAGA